MPPPPRTTRRISRRLLLAAVIFGLFVVFDLALFAFLIFDSLSERELENVLLEARDRGEPIASDLARMAEDSGEDLFVVLSYADDTKTSITEMILERDLVASVEVRRRDGTVVYLPPSGRPTVDDPDLDGLPGVGRPRISGFDGPEVDPLADPVVAESGPRSGGLTDDIELPIGEYGTLVIGLDEAAVRDRIGVLRRDLLRQTSLVGGLTLLLLLGGLTAFLYLFRRSRQLEEKALQAERMAYVGTLASGLAHEIRSPLNSLSLNMQMLEEEMRERRAGVGEARLLNITRSEIGRLERLASDFLTYARPRPLEPTALPMIDLLQRVQQVLGGELRARDVELMIEDASDGQYVEVDVAQIAQLLLNLSQNALAALEDGPDEPCLVLRAALDDDRPVLEVRDNGSGMSADVRDRVFDLFYSNRRGGTGLGLAIVQRIAENHDAEVEVESEVGVGTTVRVVFPQTVAIARPRLPRFARAASGRPVTRPPTRGR